MAKYIIQGGRKLSGEVAVSGNKNAVLPCMAASLLTEEEVILRNTPNIADMDVLGEIMKDIGVEVTKGDHKLELKAVNIKHHVLKSELMKKLRASILLAGAMLGRCGRVEFLHPGGDIIGRRGIDLHLSGFQQLGFKISSRDREYKISNGKSLPKEAKIFLEGIATVTGTENLILAAVRKKGRTVIRNAAQEPHVIDLCRLLNLMGAKITGTGSPTLFIKGVESLKGADFTIGSDDIEFGTYAIAAAITSGKIKLKNCQNLDLEPTIWPFKKMGLVFVHEDNAITVSAGKLVAIPRLVTNVWPGFPTDLMSVLIVLATQAKGVSLLHDWIYESRMFFVDKLISMGANITIADPHRVLVYGPTTLYGRNLETPDIRAGMALVLAALIARGESVINRAELIERGYEEVVEKLTSLGAAIQRID